MLVGCTVKINNGLSPGIWYENKICHECRYKGHYARSISCRFRCLKPRANARNIVGQQLPTLLHVASVCTPCCMLLGVVGQSLKPVELFSQQLPTFLLFRDR